MVKDKITYKKELKNGSLSKLVSSLVDYKLEMREREQKLKALNEKNLMEKNRFNNIFWFVMGIWFMVFLVLLLNLLKNGN